MVNRAAEILHQQVHERVQKLVHDETIIEKWEDPGPPEPVCGHAPVASHPTIYTPETVQFEVPAKDAFTVPLSWWEMLEEESGTVVMTWGADTDREITHTCYYSLTIDINSARVKITALIREQT